MTDNKNLAGHRLRLRNRFMRSSIRSLPDYEILEMVLFQVFHRKDTKELSKILLNKFGSLAAVISADPVELRTIPGIGDTSIIYFKLLHDLFSRLFIPIQLEDVHILNSWLAVLNYCQLTMGFKKKEYFRVLFLNRKNLLIADELFDSGTIDRIVVYPREIARQSLVHGASAVILVHNHPSGDISPSKEDIEITQKISNALSSISVNLHDHLIIAQDKHFSFRANNLL